jgi:branched-chain amino acid aminotransferase
VLYLDAKEDKYIEEVSSCNMFVVKGNTIRTPPAGETILAGITRKSVIHMARARGYEVIEERVLVSDVMLADEVFCTGTAVVVVPVGSITYGDNKCVPPPNSLHCTSPDARAMMQKLRIV